MKIRMLMVGLVLALCGATHAQTNKTVPISLQVAGYGYSQLWLDKVTVTETYVTCYFVFENKSPGPRSTYSNTNIGLRGAYADEYNDVELTGISLGMSYVIKAAGAKRFSVAIERPAGELFLKGISCGIATINASVRISGSGNRKANVNISSVVDNIRIEKRAEPQTPTRVDASKPTITLRSPSLIQNIYRTEEASVTVRGKVSDPEGIASVHVNSKNASLKADGSFMSRVRLRIGKNPVKIEAMDINDNVGSKAFHVMREEFIEEDEFADIDFPPETGNTNSDGIAVVFGIEEYQYAPTVTSAYNDADIFREYLITTFGFERENIYFRTNNRATKGEFEKAFSKNGWIENNATESSDVFIFYAGHGAPEIDTKKTYLVPHDVDPNYATTGYSLEELYVNLGQMKVRSITVVMDACFSGGTRDNQALLVDARPLSIGIDNGVVMENTIVFCAASGSEISSAYKQKNHGIFTYFFLKGLGGGADGNHDKEITVSEMQQYLSEHVSAQARKMGREQNPQLLGSDRSRVLLRY